LIAFLVFIITRISLFSTYRTALTIIEENFITTSIRTLEGAFNSSYGTVTIEKGTLYSENREVIYGQYALMDQLGDYPGYSVTFFACKRNDFKRIATNIVDEDR
jgi:hypothetical protein